jgi:hypothetical protein
VAEVQRHRLSPSTWTATTTTTTILVSKSMTTEITVPRSLKNASVFIGPEGVLPSTLFQSSPVQILITHLFKIYFNIILPSTSLSSKWLLFSPHDFHWKFCMYFSPLLRTEIIVYIDNEHTSQSDSSKSLTDGCFQMNRMQPHIFILSSSNTALEGLTMAHYMQYCYFSGFYPPLNTKNKACSVAGSASVRTWICPFHRT